MTAPVRALFTAALLAALPLAPLARAQDVPGAAPSLVLFEEAVLVDGSIEIPPDGEIEIILPAGVPEEALAIDAFSFDPRAGLFAARLLLTDGEVMGLRGQAVVTVPALVPNRRLQPGEIISDSDLDETRVAVATLPAATLRQSGELIGKEVRRALLPGRPVAEQSVMEPRAVRRGDEVLIVYGGDGIDLSATGRVLEDGALGEEVRVVNLSSNRTVTARVSAAGRVEVH